jgi:hypothetical protein
MMHSTFRMTGAALALMLSAAALAQAAPPPAPPVPPAAPAAPEAPAAPAAPTAAAVAPAAPPPPPLPSDPRERVQTVCMNEAKAKAKGVGASDVILKDVQDTDVKSDGFASMRAKVELVSIDSKGKTKKKRGTFGCTTRNDVITNFSFD